MTELENSKKVAAEKAVDFVASGMVVGLGTGSTVRYFIEKLAEELRQGRLTDIVGIATSKNTAQLSRQLVLPLATLVDYPEVDIDVDGADQVDPAFNLIKGGGGAHSREKVIATAAKEFIVVVDDTKMVERLSFPVAVETLEMARPLVEDRLIRLGGQPNLRTDFLTDNGHIVLDTRFSAIKDPAGLETAINAIPGVVENGLFSQRKPNQVIVGYRDGRVEIRKR